MRQTECVAGNLYAVLDGIYRSDQTPSVVLCARRLADGLDLRGIDNGSTADLIYGITRLFGQIKSRLSYDEMHAGVDGILHLDALRSGGNGCHNP